VLSEALRIIVGELERLEIPYALIGALAMAPHNVIRATEDVGVLIGRSAPEMGDLASRIQSLGYKLEVSKAAFDDPPGGVIIVQVPTSSGEFPCDLIFPARPWQASAVTNAVAVQMEGFSVRVVRARELFLLKLYAGGPQDLLDAAQLYEIQDSAAKADWKEAAASIGESDAFERCLRFLA
jgi:hypothetical protein